MSLSGLAKNEFQVDWRNLKQFTLKVWFLKHFCIKIRKKLLKENHSMIRAANMLITIVKLNSNYVTDTKAS